MNINFENISEKYYDFKKISLFIQSMTKNILII